MQLVATKPSAMTPASLENRDARAAADIDALTAKPSGRFRVMPVSDRNLVYEELALERGHTLQMGETTVASRFGVLPNGAFTLNQGKANAADFTTILSLVCIDYMGSSAFVPVDGILRGMSPECLAKLLCEPFFDAFGNEAAPVWTHPDTGKLILTLPPGLWPQTRAGREALASLSSSILREHRTGNSITVIQTPGIMVAFDPHAFVVLTPRLSLMPHTQIKR